jgi:hypothetical protein
MRSRFANAQRQDDANEVTVKKGSTAHWWIPVFSPSPGIMQNFGAMPNLILDQRHNLEYGAQ